MQVHTTVGLYFNGEFAVNGVHPNDLEDHIEYNKTHRPGRALIVDGKIIHRGYWPERMLAAWIEDHPKVFEPETTVSKRYR